MEQLKYSLGPFELFAAIIGGSPFVLAGFLLYHPVESLAELVEVIQENGSGDGAFAIALTLLLVSYIIGGTIQGLSWQYFLRLCKLFKCEYTYFGNQLADRNKALKQLHPEQRNPADFEDRLTLQLRETIGIPKKLSWMDSRLKAYLRERNSPSVAAADTLVASHIMFRNLSLGCLILCAVSVANSVRLGALEPLLLSPFVGYVAYLMFRRSVSFKKWQNRTLVLGFYFAATQESASEGRL
ncbi:MAG: hypothetical protein AAF572_26055 [Cyanobacteria bacterium P01_B01_bin.77]